MANSKHPIGIIGAGTMGAGIAQLAATHGWTVFLSDVDKGVIRKGIDGVQKRLDRLVDKGIMTVLERKEALSRIRAAKDESDLKECDLVIEAVVEDLGVKTMVLSRVARVLPKDAVIASNTSALSITRIADALGEPFRGRVIGMHLFNPAPLMPLVEVAGTEYSSAEALKRATLIAEAWGKTVVRCNDTPGFIVNRVARPYYLEAFRIVEDGYANVDEVDKAMRDLGAFRMGPFELTDLIGHDVNSATTQSVWEQLGKPARLKPSKVQSQLVKDGHLGHKSKHGAYKHDVEPPTPAIQITRRSLATNDRLHDAVEKFVDRATDQIGSPLERYIFARVLVAIVNEAAWALTENVASARDINLALKLGTNYPKGPLEWAEEIGYGVCGELLDALNATVLDKRFEAPEMLKARV
jgi:3-hydroxybutyryl-CoA dehydrogenase